MPIMKIRCMNFKILFSLNFLNSLVCILDVPADIWVHWKCSSNTEPCVKHMCWQPHVLDWREVFPHHGSVYSAARKHGHAGWEAFKPSRLNEGFVCNLFPFQTCWECSENCTGVLQGGGAVSVFARMETLTPTCQERALNYPFLDLYIEEVCYWVGFESFHKCVF